MVIVLWNGYLLFIDIFFVSLCFFLAFSSLLVSSSFSTLYILDSLASAFSIYPFLLAENVDFLAHPPLNFCRCHFLLLLSAVGFSTSSLLLPFCPSPTLHSPFILFLPPSLCCCALHSHSSLFRCAIFAIQPQSYHCVHTTSPSLLRVYCHRSIVI